ncbi:hypothetical protein [Streptomyces sp. NPDC001661]
MKSHDWQFAIRNFALFWIALPALTYAWFTYLKRLAELTKPWENPKAIPFTPIPIPKRKQHVRLRVRRSVSSVRALGGPVTKGVDEYTAAYSEADATYSWFARNGFLFFLFEAIALPFAATLIKGIDAKDVARMQFSWSQINATIAFAGILASFALAFICFRRLMGHFSRIVADLGAIRRCFLVLEEIYSILRGSGSYLALDEKVSKFCRELTDFTRIKWQTADPERFSAISLHVTAVQGEIRKASGRVLKDGKIGLPEVAGIHMTVLERLIDERWLSLLDVEDAEAPAPGLVEPSDIRQERRAAWIVILGATAGAAALGFATAAGIPLTVSVPAALVFLLGPATLWGGRRLGMGSRDLMESLKGSFSASGQQGAAPSQPPSGSGNGGPA